MNGIHPQARALKYGYVLTAAWLLVLVGGLGLVLSDIRAAAVGVCLVAVATLGGSFFVEAGALLPRGARLRAWERRARLLMLVTMAIATVASLVVVAPRSATSTEVEIAVVIVVVGVSATLSAVFVLVRIPRAAADSSLH